MSTRGYTSPVSSQKQDEPSSSGVLNYRNASPDLKSKRLTDWKKYQHFTASIPIRGNFEQHDGVRTDAPTSDLETHCMVAAFAACNRTTIRSSDISNAYFQAQPLDRVILMRQPQGELPGVDPEAALLVRVPVYGLRDSGRWFWVKVDKDAK